MMLAFLAPAAPSLQRGPNAFPTQPLNRSVVANVVPMEHSGLHDNRQMPCGLTENAVQRVEAVVPDAQGIVAARKVMSHFSDRPPTSHEEYSSTESECDFYMSQVDGSDSRPSKKRAKKEKYGKYEDRQSKQKQSKASSYGKGESKDSSAAPPYKVPDHKPKKVKAVYEPLSPQDPRFTGFLDRLVDACTDELHMRHENSDIEEDEFDPEQTLKVSAYITRYS